SASHSWVPSCSGSLKQFFSPTSAAKRRIRSPCSGGAGAASIIASFEQLVSRQGEELGERLGQHQPVEQLARLLQMGLGGQAAKLLHFLVSDLLVQLLSGHAAVVELRAPVYPEPDLRARDLGGGRVLHQIEDGHRAVAAP